MKPRNWAHASPKSAGHPQNQDGPGSGPSCPWFHDQRFYPLILHRDPHGFWFSSNRGGTQMVEFQHCGSSDVRRRRLLFRCGLRRWLCSRCCRVSSRLAAGAFFEAAALAAGFSSTFLAAAGFAAAGFAAAVLRQQFCASSLRGTRLGRSSFSGRRLSRCRLRRSSFRGSGFRGSGFRGSTFRRGRLCSRLLRRAGFFAALAVVFFAATGLSAAGFFAAGFLSRRLFLFGH